MKRFNLSAWAVGHPALILFLVVALSVAGYFSYRGLGRAEDPSFTVKVVVVTAIWPGATRAAWMAAAPSVATVLAVGEVFTQCENGFAAVSISVVSGAS